MVLIKNMDIYFKACVILENPKNMRVHKQDINIYKKKDK